MKALLLTLALLLISSTAFSNGAAKKSFKPLDYIKNKDWEFVPVPVYETRPDEGNTYGIMPVLLMSDKGNEAIKAIFSGIAQYNTVTKFDGVALAYFYPEPEQEILFYAETAQKYARELSVRFFDPHLGKFYTEANAVFIKSPFGRFYGLGPKRTEKNQSNYTARSLNIDLKGGYYLTHDFHLNYGFQLHSTDMLNRAIELYDDTITRYGALPEVLDSTNFIHEISATYDSRTDREYSTKGTMADARFFLSNKSLGSDKDFHGYQFQFIHLFPWQKPNMVTAFRFNMKQLFGTGIPFYEQSGLGGDKEMRNFVTGRYVDRGKMVFQVEQRIKAFSWRLFGKSFDIHLDPFLEMGRVYKNVNEIGFKYWQPAAGLGFRLFVPPNVVGRVDMAIGSDGFEIYTALGYPF
ncbi:MAG: surface antigen (D15) [uncultured bacterium]|nr:MAG: surface antigen (D15) [uncultured bacterium]